MKYNTIEMNKRKERKRSDDVLVIPRDAHTNEV